MIEFDGYIAKLSLEYNGVFIPFNLNLADIRNNPDLKDSALANLSPNRLRAALEYADHTFKVNPSSVVPVQQQFIGHLKAVGSLVLDPDSRIIGAASLGAIVSEVNAVNRELLEKAGVNVGRKSEAVSFQYFSGVHHMTLDDDFLAVRKGGKIVGMIPLPGNDYNEVKRFIKEGRNDILSVKNIGDLKNCVRKVKQSKAADLVCSLASPRRQKAVNELKL